MNPDLMALRPYPMAELQARKAELRASGNPVFDFGTGDPLEPTPALVREALINAIPAISQYPSVAGTSGLREAAAAYCQRRFGVSLDPAAQVLPSAGSKESIFHLPLAFLDPSSGRDTVVYGTPGYPVYEHGTRFANGQPHPVTLDRANGYRLDLDQLPGDVIARTRIAWLNYPHNPTGATVDLGWLQAQAAFCRAHDILLVGDECYADLYFDDSPPPSLLQAGSEGLLVVHSCSKRSGMTGYRSGFIAGDTALIASYRRWRAAMGVASPAFIEAAGAAAWADDAHAGERRAVFARRYQLLADGLSALGISVLPSQAGLYLWARTPAGWDDDAWAGHCLDHGIIVSPGGFFGDGGAGCFRLALVPDDDTCRAALAAWPTIAPAT